MTLQEHLDRRLAWERLSRQERERRLAGVSAREELAATRERAAEELAAEFGTDVSEWRP